MTKLEQLALTHFLKGPSEPPRLVGAMVMTRLLDRRWVTPYREGPSTPRLYAITAEGEVALGGA